MPSAATEFLYPIGACLHEGERQASYETIYKGAPAILKFYRADSALEVSKLVDAAAESEPRLLDCGEAEVFQTKVVYVIALRDEAAGSPVVPVYRRFGWFAIGGAVAAAAMCLLLIRGAEKKAAPVVVAPAVPAIVHAEPVAAAVTTPAVSHAVKHRKKRHTSAVR